MGCATCYTILQFQLIPCIMMYMITHSASVIFSLPLTRITGLAGIFLISDHTEIYVVQLHCPWHMCNIQKESIILYLKLLPQYDFSI